MTKRIPTNPIERFGRNLYRVRRSCDLTQEDVAHQINVSVRSIQYLEAGRCYPRVTVLYAMAKLYGTTMDKLMEGVEA